MSARALTWPWVVYHQYQKYQKRPIIYQKRPSGMAGVVYHQYCTHSTALTFLTLVLCRPSSHHHPPLPFLGLPFSSLAQVSTLEIGGWAQTGNEGVRWQGVGRGGRGDGAGVALQALGVATSLFFLAGAFFAVKVSHRRAATRADARRTHE